MQCKLLPDGTIRGICGAATMLVKPDNLERRLLDHLSDNEKNNCIKTNVRITSREMSTQKFPSRVIEMV